MSTARAELPEEVRAAPERSGAVYGIRHLRRAAAAVCDEGRPAAERVCEAMLSVWSGCAARDFWPEPLRRQSEEVLDLIFERGSISSTAAAADEPTLFELRRAICRFAAEAERAHHRPVSDPC